MDLSKELWGPTNEQDHLPDPKYKDLPLPLTPEREHRFKTVIQQRQHSLTLVLENIHDPHNVSAILRTCDAVGIYRVHVITSKSPKEHVLSRRSSASARKWVNVTFHPSPELAVEHLHQQGFKVFSTHIHSEAIGLYEMDLCQPVALAFGNEKDGCSPELLALSDGNFVIPMMGLIESLNVSVATAVSLYEAHRQRSAAGMYDGSQSTPEFQEQLLHKWAWL